MKLKHIIYLIIAVAAISCSKGSILKENNPAEELVGGIFTKGTGDGKAYRVYLNGIDGTVTVGKEYTGTYADKTAGGEFTPCTVTQQGTFSAVDNTGENGLRAIDGPYKMHIVYPAIAMSPIEGHSGINGYLFNRKLSQGEIPVYISDTLKVNVSGVYVIDENSDSQYIYDASNLDLKQQRSKINITFKCGESIPSTTLQYIIFKNVINKGYYRPCEGRFYYDADDIDSDEIYTSQQGLKLTRGQSQKVVTNQYILSMDYSAKDSQGTPKWPLPSFEIRTGESAEESVTFTAALGWNFLPQNSYDFTITINSTYADVTVTASAWEGNGLSGGNISQPQSWTIRFPIENGGEYNINWEEVNGGTGTIE